MFCICMCLYMYVSVYVCVRLSQYQSTPWSVHICTVGYIRISTYATGCKAAATTRSTTPRTPASIGSPLLSPSQLTALSSVYSWVGICVQLSVSYTYLYIHTHTHIHVYVYICICIYKFYVYIYIYICIHIYMYIHTYIYICR
jgi:hypothetical protein